jgi:magnesium-transporting ATPase (P-type)
VTVELVQFVLVWMITADQDMYDDTTDTRALARSTIVSDLGRVEYIFSDKTGTLTQNVMRFKRCSVDGLVFGAPVVKHEGDSPFHPSRQLLVGCFRERPGSSAFSAQTAVDTGEMLTFNAGKPSDRSLLHVDG